MYVCMYRIIPNKSVSFRHTRVSALLAPRFSLTPVLVDLAVDLRQEPLPGDVALPQLLGAVQRVDHPVRGEDFVARYVRLVPYVDLKIYIADMYVCMYVCMFFFAKAPVAEPIMNRMWYLLGHHLDEELVCFEAVAVHDDDDVMLRRDRLQLRHRHEKPNG